jgi:glutathione S-transferase
MKLHDVPFSSNCKKVRITAEELGLPLEIVPVTLPPPDPGYKALNPMGKVPTLEDGDFVLFESCAICDYLAAKAPDRGLAPTDAQGRADLWRWLTWFSAHLQPWVSTMAIERFIKPAMMKVPGDDHVAAYAQREVQRFLPVLDARLTGREYVLGRFSIADIVLGCGTEPTAQLGVDLSAYPAVQAWLGRLQSRESWKKNTIAFPGR